MDRRAFISAAAIVPFGGVIMANEVDKEVHLDHMIAIADHTGIAVDDLYDWFRGVDLTQIVENMTAKPSITWSTEQTTAALTGYKAMQTMGHDQPLNPLTRLTEAQFRLKADRAEVKRFITKAPACMDGLKDLVA